MSDSYLNFANTKFGAKLTSMLGLPQPLQLERQELGQPVIGGKVLLGGFIDADTQAAGDRLNESVLNSIKSLLSSMDVHALSHHAISERCTLPQWNREEKVKALIFDASNLTDSSQSSALYDFFHSTTRSVLPNGRVIILGRPPENCDSPVMATMQRALEGLSRSLAKELRKAINVQLVYVDVGAELELESTLRFLLSPKSAYVSGQVIRVSSAVNSTNTDVDWAKPLASKKVLVTGASQGIGLAIAEVMARDGAHCVCLDIPAAEQALKAASERLNGSRILLDLNVDDAPEQLANAAHQQGGWDIVIHNAGITRDKTIAKMPKDWWANVVNLNLNVQERINDKLVACGGIRPGGRIICVSSISGIAGNRGQTNYALSKAGVIGMVESHAQELASKDITINAVAPGFIETEMTARMPFSVREAGRRLNSLSQGGLPIDVAEAASWFANPASSGVTGNVVRVCGQSLLGA